MNITSLFDSRIDIYYSHLYKSVVDGTHISRHISLKNGRYFSTKMATTATKTLSLLLARCVPSVKKNASKFRITRLVFDGNLNAYFPEHEFVFAHDPNGICKTGDVAMIRELPKKLTTLITYEVDKVVYKLGDVQDPVTGKLVAGDQYRDQIEETNRLYGKSDTAFDYKKAPPRGRLEGDRDLTDKEIYRKSHDDGKFDPYAW